MANQNIRTPIFFPDLIGYIRDRQGSGVITQITGSNLISMPSGSTVNDLVDGRPLNSVTFDTSSAASTDHILFNFNFGSTNHRCNYIAILNHNMKTADTAIKVFAGNATSDINAINGSGDINTSSVSATEVINAGGTIAAADSNSSWLITPGTDGHTLITFPEQTYRYWGIQFEGTDSNDFDDTTDLFIGNIMMGESYTMPRSPDLNLTKSIHYDGVKVQESVGGQRYGSATNLGKVATTSGRSPFNVGEDYTQFTHGGRQMFDLNFSYINSTDLIPDNMQSMDFDDDSVFGDVWNITNGAMRPFIFGVDNTITGSNAESSYLYARFGMNSLNMNQVANDVYNVNLRIEEEI